MIDLDVEDQAELELLCVARRNKEILILAHTKLKPLHFRNDLNKWCFEVMSAYFKEYKDSPPDKVLYHQIRKGNSKLIEERTEYIKLLIELSDKLRDRDFLSVDYWIDHVLKIKIHCDQCLLHEAMQDRLIRMDVQGFQDLINAYNPEDLDEYADFPEDHASTFSGRILAIDNEEERSKKYLKFGIKDENGSMDDYFDGIYEPSNGIFTSVIGATKGGKSQYMIGIGGHACQQGFNVLDVVLEGNKKYIDSQYDAFFTKFLVKDLFHKRLNQEQKAFADRKISNLPGKLRVVKAKSGHTTFDDIEELIEKREKKFGEKTHVVIVRPIYGLSPTSIFNARDGGLRTAKMMLYKEGKKFSENNGGRLLFVEDQVATLSAYNKNLTKYDIAECKGASAELDFLLGIACTHAEFKRKIARIQILVSRLGEGEGTQFKVRKDFARSRYLNGW